jgi:hypothetical protein
MQTLFFIGQNPSLLGETQVAGDLGWVARFFLSGQDSLSSSPWSFKSLFFK